MTATLHCTDPLNDYCPCCGVRLRDGKREIDILRAEIERLRAVILNIQALAEGGFPIDSMKLATRCRFALAYEQSVDEKRCTHGTPESQVCGKCCGYE